MENSILERIKTYDAEYLAKHIIEFLSQLSPDDKKKALDNIYERAQQDENLALLWRSLLDPGVVTYIGHSEELQQKATRRLLQLTTKIGL